MKFKLGAGNNAQVYVPITPLPYWVKDQVFTKNVKTGPGWESWSLGISQVCNENDVP